LSQTLAVAPATNHYSRSELTYPVRTGEIDVGLVDPLSSSEWDREVLSSSESSVFHLAAWARVINLSYGHKPIYFRFVQGGKLAALLPIIEVSSPLTGTRGVSLPFSDFCDPLIFDGSIDASILLEAVNKIALERSWKYFEVRSNLFAQYVTDSPQQYYEHTLDLRLGANRLFAGLEPSVRRAVRKAKERGLEIQISNSWQAVREFYRLHVRTRKRHGLPPQPLSFFHNIYREIISAGYGFVVVAKAAIRPVAAAVFFHSGHKAIYKFGASDAGSQHLRGNNLVMWKAIEHLAGSGFHCLNFGRTDLEDEGLRRFKRSWGTSEQKLGYFRFQVVPGSANNRWFAQGHGYHTRIFRRLPLFVNRIVGKLVYPHLD